MVLPLLFHARNMISKSSFRATVLRTLTQRFLALWSGSPGFDSWPSDPSLKVSGKDHLGLSVKEPADQAWYWLPNKKD